MTISSCLSELLPKAVPLSKRGSTTNYTKCQKQSPNTCELHCKHCKIPICALCVSSGDHDKHKEKFCFENISSKKQLIEKDLQELEKIIYPYFQLRKPVLNNIP